VSQALERAAQFLGHRLDETSRPRLTDALHQLCRRFGVSEERIERLLEERHADTLRLLADHLTVCETYFFRSPEHFELLAALAQQAAEAGHPFNFAWCVGCATGEEVYSLAMTLLPHAPKLKVVGTDVSQRSLELARLACYRSRSFRGRTAETIPDLIRVPGGEWRVAPRIRDRCSFEIQNVASGTLRPPPPLPNRVDVIMCRNLLIYLRPELGQKVERSLLDSLNENGVMLLGAVEGRSRVPDGFRMLDEPSCHAVQRIKGATHPALPAFVPSRQVGPAVTLGKARELADQGDFGGALEHLKPMGEHPDALFLKGVICTERGELMQAETIFRHLCVIAPHFVAPRFRLLLLALRRGDVESQARLRRELIDCLAAQPDDDEAHHIRSVLVGLDLDAKR
jgi:chemotaxis protein methyltransferase CheR